MMALHRTESQVSPRNARIERWLSHLLVHTIYHQQELHPTLQEFRIFIETNPTVFQLFQSMFQEVPRKSPYDQDPTGQPQVRDYFTMLEVFNGLMTKSPAWTNGTEGQQNLAGFPFNAVLAYPMATSAGIAIFSRPDVNEHIRNILRSWAEFLDSPASLTALSTDPRGWLGYEALDAMASVVNECTPGTSISFAQAFVCDPTAFAYGYKSWDDFFTRRWRRGVRPTASLDDSSVVCNACESCPYRISYNVKLSAEFSIKSQPYSLLDMLENSPLALQFNGGTVYQGFLSALSYHRWHAPVTGTIAKLVHIPGTYFLQSPHEGFLNLNSNGESNPDRAAPNKSQAFLCQKATRALIFIQADDPRIGLMILVLVGMAEVSSCETFVKEGQRVRKGDEIGTFHYGGSTHCLVFRPEVKLRFVRDEPFGKVNIPVCSALAVLESNVKI